MAEITPHSGVVGRVGQEMGGHPSQPAASVCKLRDAREARTEDPSAQDLLLRRGDTPGIPFYQPPCLPFSTSLNLPDRDGPRGWLAQQSAGLYVGAGTLTTGFFGARVSGRVPTPHLHFRVTPGWRPPGGSGTPASARCATVRVSVSTRVSLPTYVTVGKDGCDGACVCVRACVLVLAASMRVLIRV